MRENYGSVPELRLQINIEYTDGARETVSTDGTWQGGTGAIAYSDILMGEFYDSRKAPVGWDSAGFRAASWPRALVSAAAAPTKQLDVTAPLRAMAVQ